VLDETPPLGLLRVFLELRALGELEPPTLSLPWRFWGGTGGHSGAPAATILLQIGPYEWCRMCRACPRVHDLMYPSRTRAVLSICKTPNGRADAAGGHGR